MKKNTKEKIISKFIEIHDNKYDYSKVDYINYHKKVCVICPIHGEFFITPANHINGRGCNLCKVEKLKKCFSHTTIFFVDESKKIHGNKYDYSKVEYVNSTTKVCIICPTHGEFWQTPQNHLKGCGCKKCSCESTHILQKSTTEEFIKHAKEVHR